MSDEENGAVAQLGERFGGIEEVRGSSPRSSTTKEDRLKVLREIALWFAELRGGKVDLGLRFVMDGDHFWVEKPTREVMITTSLEDEQAAWQQVSAEAFWRVEEELEEEAQVSDEMTEDGLTGRALELADLVSDMIWGGERGWERATNEQFKHLKSEARKRMKI